MKSSHSIKTAIFKVVQKLEPKELGFYLVEPLNDKQEESLAYTVRTAPARFCLPNHDYVRPHPMRIGTKSISIDRRPKFFAAELGSLPNGTAFVVCKGRELKTFCNNPADYAMNPSLP